MIQIVESWFLKKNKLTQRKINMSAILSPTKSSHLPNVLNTSFALARLPSVQSRTWERNKKNDPVINHPDKYNRPHKTPQNKDATVTWLGVTRVFKSNHVIKSDTSFVINRVII